MILLQINLTFLKLNFTIKEKQEEKHRKPEY